jgi:two-component system response regulator MprA
MRVLLVEDEPAVRDAVERALRSAGHKADLAREGPAGLEMAMTNPYDTVVLDLGLPGIDGVEVCRRLRASGNQVPVLMLTARAAVRDRVEGLDAGADDYLVKPYSLDELLARVRALLRRTAVDDTEPVLQLGDLNLDPRRRLVTRSERTLELTKTEFDLLELLLINAGIVLTRDQIYSEIWGYDFETSSKSLDVYISYLRRKTEEHGEPRLIHTVRGVGYTARES